MADPGLIPPVAGHERRRRGIRPRAGPTGSYVDVPWETWAEHVLAHAGFPPYVEEHVATVARLHRENRYDRQTDTVEEITGRPAESVEHFVARRRDLFAE